MKRRLILLVAVMALSGALTACSEISILLGRPVVYQARVTLLIGNLLQPLNPDDFDPDADEHLIQEYVALALSAEVLAAAVEAGGFPETPEVSAHVIENTLLLVLTVNHEDPDLAVAMANEVAHQVVLHAPSSLTPEQQAELGTATKEMDRLRKALEELHSQRDDIERQLAVATDPAKITDLKERQAAIDTQIVLVTSSMTHFADTIVSLKQRTNSVEIVEAAILLGPSE